MPVSGMGRVPHRAERRLLACQGAVSGWVQLPNPLLTLPAPALPRCHHSGAGGDGVGWRFPRGSPRRRKGWCRLAWRRRARFQGVPLDSARGELCRAVPCRPGALPAVPGSEPARSRESSATGASPAPQLAPAWPCHPSARARPSPWCPHGGRAVCPHGDTGAGGIRGLRPAPVGLSRAPCCVSQGERDAGKGLEMRKLVLSGFLASEEIYINQLEALLLVSTARGGGAQDGWMGSLLLGQPLPSQPAWHRSVCSPASSRGHAGPRGQDVVAQREGHC